MRVILMVGRFCSQAMSLIGLAILDLWVAVTEPWPEDDERGAPGS
jgi:hypothetical protein